MPVDQFWYKTCLSTIQLLDELGGPEGQDYIDTQRALAKECLERAAQCEQNSGQRSEGPY